MHPGLYIMFGGAVSGDDDIIGQSDNETTEDEGVRCVGQSICIYPYVHESLPRCLEKGFVLTFNPNLERT